MTNKTSSKRQWRRRAKSPDRARPLTLGVLQSEIKALQRKQEVKAFNVESTAQNIIGTVGSIVPVSLCDLAQGVDQQQRVGDTITARNAHVQYQVLYNTNPVGAQFIRVVIFQDFRGQYTQVPSWSSTGTGVFAGSGFSNADVGNLGRFKILYDKTHVLDSIDHYGEWEKFNLPINTPIHFEGSGATSGTKGRLWIMYYSNQTVNFPTINFNSQLRYTDD